MEMKKNISVSLNTVLLITALITILLLQSCSKIEQTNPNCDSPFFNQNGGRILSHTDCKIIGGVINKVIPASDECIEYKYFSNYRIILLTHLNAGLNCCPGKIDASYAFSNDTIRIFEKQQKAGCRCDCLYDINYEIRYIDPGKYHIEIFGPIADGINRPQFSCVINIPDDTDSTFCMSRGYYPWQE